MEQVIPHWVDFLIHVLDGSGGVAMIGVGWKVMRRLNRDEDLRQDFPPHRHINGKILYPRDYEPALVEKLHGGD